MVDDDSVLTLEDFLIIAAADDGLITLFFFTVLLLMLTGMFFCLDADGALCDLRGSADAEDDLELTLTESELLFKADQLLMLSDDPLTASLGTSQR